MNTHPPAMPPVARTMTAGPRLHEREEVATSYVGWPISRYRVPGGWLYHTRGGGYPSPAVALCFVPDAVVS